MSRINWDKPGERFYETGVDHGVLYMPTNGNYDNGVAWNGLTSVSETPSGAEATPVYADNMKYLNLMSVEEFGGTIEALYYPDAFLQFDGGTLLAGGIVLGQQGRPKFGLSYRTLLGNDLVAENAGYKLHLVYGAQASPSERTHTTINDSPEASPMSWEFSTTAVPVEGHRPTAHLTIDSTKVSGAELAALETILYGSDGVDPRLPLPDEVLALFAGSATPVRPAAPVWSPTARTITIPTTSNVVYMIDDEVVSGVITLPAGETEVVQARPAAGYYFAANSDDDWAFGE